MVIRRYPFPLHLRWLCFTHRLLGALPSRLDGLAWRRNFLPSQRPPPILDGNVSVSPFAHQHFVLRRRTMALRRQLQPPILVPHHPIVADPALALQSENPVQLSRSRRATMIVLALGRRSREPAIVLRQIFPLQVHVRRLVTTDFFSPQFFHQTILMRAVLPLHSSLGLRRTGRDHLDPQLRAHAPKLRDRLLSPQLLLHRGRSLVQILPIHIQRLRHSVPLDPGAQRIGHRPDRFLFAQLRPRRAGSVIHQVDQAAPRSALFQPRVEAAVHLHHLSKMLFALPPQAVPPPFPLPAPQPFRQHPAPQRFRVDLQPVFQFQVLGRQRRSKWLPHPSAVLVRHAPQHRLSKLLLVRAIRAAPRSAVLQPRGPLLPIPLPQPLRLPVTHSHQTRRIHHLQRFAFHPRQYFHSPQFPRAHLCPLQLDLL